MILVLTAMMLIISTQGSVAAGPYNEEVSTAIPPGSYYAGEMKLSSGQTVHIQLSVTGTIVDFYFMDSAGYSQFRSAASSPWGGSFSYFPDLSVLGSYSIDKSATVPQSGTYYVVVANFDTSQTAFLSGRITASGAIIGPLVSNLPIILLIVAIVTVIIASIVVASRLAKTWRIESPATFLPGQIQHYQQSIHQPSYTVQSQASWNSIAFCPYCGARVEDWALFCTKCGRRIR